VQAKASCREKWKSIIRGGHCQKWNSRAFFGFVILIPNAERLSVGSKEKSREFGLLEP
jgi:hypothetical protein